MNINDNYQEDVFKLYCIFGVGRAKTNTPKLQHRKLKRYIKGNFNSKGIEILNKAVWGDETISITNTIFSERVDKHLSENDTSRVDIPSWNLFQIFHKISHYTVSICCMISTDILAFVRPVLCLVESYVLS